MGIYMAEVQTNQPEIEAIARAQATYASIVRTAVNDARVALVNGVGMTHAVDGVLSILTPEVLEALNGPLGELKKAYDINAAAVEAKFDDGSDDFRIALHYCARQYNLKRLNEIVRVLDEYGLLRDRRYEQVGGP